MEQVNPSKTDDQLEAILHDAADWAIIGSGERYLCFAASLHRALDRAAALGADGAIVTALSRQPFDNIIVEQAQMRRLRKTIAGREVLPIKFTDDWADTEVEPSEARTS